MADEVSEPEPEAQPEEMDFRLFGNTVKVSLEEEEEEMVVNERPAAYYFAEYSDEQRRQFAQVAISGEEVNLHSKEILVDTWKVVDLRDHNDRVARDNRKKRPGMKKRRQAIEGRKRREERERQLKKKERDEKKKMKLRKFGRAKATPKFRTE